ncbi:MAG: hypothetical protein D6816_18135 [Bacteroidetes bacterium]|nr:MAG: hypothetical protein D6816_18135 [Bacteroidota bacterium]
MVLSHFGDGETFQMKQNKITVEFIISLLVVSVVGTMLKTSGRFTDFAHSLNIRGDFGVNLLASIITFIIGGAVFLTLTKFFKNRKNAKP